MARKEQLRATVVSCEPSESLIRGTVVPCFEIRFEFLSSEGIVGKSIKRGNAMDVGTTFYVNYYKDGSVEMTNAPSKRIKNMSILLGAFGAVAALALLFVLAINFGKLNDKGIGCLIGIVLCMIFMFLGIYAGVIYPRKERNVDGCILVEGRVCDCVRTSVRRYLWAQYTSIYEYWYNGERRVVGSSGSSIRKDPIGKKVTIAVNRETEEAFCENEQKNFYFGGFLLIAAGAFFTVFLIWEMFRP